MRRLVAWVIDGLPFDPRSRRALDETMLDWANETARETSNVQRAFAHALGLAGVLRAIIGCSFGEIGRVPSGWLVRRVGIFSLPMSLLLMLPPTMYMATTLGYARSAGVVVWLLPGNLIGVFAPALLLALSWRLNDRRVPAVGTAILASLAMFVLIAWVVPMSDEMFNERLAVTASEIQKTARATQPVHEPTVVDLVRQLNGPTHTQRAAISGLARIAGWSALAGLTTLLGAGLSRRFRMHGVHLIVAIPAAHIAGMLADFVAVRRIVPGVFSDAAQVWTFVVLTLAVFGLVNRWGTDATAMEARQ